MTAIEQADVVIAGGGPVGLLIAYQLARFGCKPCLVEQDDKQAAQPYGRASTMWPRTIELLDQLGLAESLLQHACVTRTAYHYRDGKEARGGLMYGADMDRLEGTFCNFALHLRQCRTEELLADAARAVGAKIHSRTRFEGFVVAVSGAFPVGVRVRDLASGAVREIHAKYLVGADGARSAVRTAARIPFTSTRTPHRWARLDVRLTADLPHPRALCSVASAAHGQVLWCPLDGGRTRLGFVLAPALLARHGGAGALTGAVLAREAAAALRPFRVAIADVEWSTVYSIGQGIAARFAEGRVFLAGDACHTHSSGSAQGLNTGAHDAVNLAWKLALCVRGLAPAALLTTYDAERRPVVQQVIDNDATISALISGQLPPRFAGRTEDPRDILTEWFSDKGMQAFTLGLGISYESSLLSLASTCTAATIKPGARGPDVYVSAIGTGEPIRLHRILDNAAMFTIVVFAGAAPRPALAPLHAAAARLAAQHPGVLRWATLFADDARLADAPAGVGHAYADARGAAHAAYGVDVRRGAAAAVRPDGWVGAVVACDAAGARALEAYFARVLGGARARSSAL